jgi:hypothetical protein
MANIKKQKSKHISALLRIREDTVPAAIVATTL